MKLRVIQATEEHLEDVAGLFDKFRVFYKKESNLEDARKFIKERFGKKDSVIFLAIDEDQSKAVGYIQLYPSFSSVLMKRIWILNDIFVLPEERRKGVGKLLMQKAQVFVSSTGAGRIILCTEFGNEDARSLYESMGYKKDPFIYYRLEPV